MRLKSKYLDTSTQAATKLLDHMRAAAKSTSGQASTSEHWRLKKKHHHVMHDLPGTQMCCEVCWTPGYTHHLHMHNATLLSQVTCYMSSLDLSLRSLPAVCANMSASEHAQAEAARVSDLNKKLSQRHLRCVVSGVHLSLTLCCVRHVLLHILLCHASWAITRFQQPGFQQPGFQQRGLLEVVCPSEGVAVSVLVGVTLASLFVTEALQAVPARPK